MTTATVPVPVPLSARNATLADLAGLLKVQHDLKHDVVVPASAITSTGGLLSVAGAGPDGPSGAAGVFRPTDVCDEGLSDKLRIPLPYLRRLRAERTDLFDANVNGWLRGTAPFDPLNGEVRRLPDADPDGRSFLVRCFNSPDLGEGIARAFLSDRFRIVDNLDVLLAALDGAKQAGIEIEIDGCDLSERKMQVRLVAPEITYLAPLLLRHYRSPFDGRPGSELPVITAGLVLGNSETGGARFTLVPRFRVEVCRNGLRNDVDAIASTHLGGRMDSGVVRWSTATMERNLALVRSQTADAVRSFLNVEYMQKVLTAVEEKATVPLARPADAVQYVTKRLAFTEDQAAGILDHFIKAGDTTAGGVMGAVTSYAQTVADPDAASFLESAGFAALDLAVAAATN